MSPSGSPTAKVRNVAHEVRNVAHEVRNVAREVRNVAREVRNVAREVRNVAHEVRNVAREVGNGLLAFLAWKARLSVDVLLRQKNYRLNPPPQIRLAKS